MAFYDENENRTGVYKIEKESAYGVRTYLLRRECLMPDIDSLVADWAFSCCHKGTSNTETPSNFTNTRSSHFFVSDEDREKILSDLIEELYHGYGCIIYCCDTGARYIRVLEEYLGKEPFFEKIATIECPSYPYYGPEGETENCDFYMFNKMNDEGSFSTSYDLYDLTEAKYDYQTGIG